MPPDLALSSTLIGSNYPCLELIFVVPKVFEPLTFDCIVFINFVKIMATVSFFIKQQGKIDINDAQLVFRWYIHAHFSSKGTVLGFLLLFSIIFIITWNKVEQEC